MYYKIVFNFYFQYEAIKYWNTHGNKKFIGLYALSFWSSVSPNKNSSITDFYLKKQKDYIKQADILFETSNYNGVINLLAPYKVSFYIRNKPVLHVTLL